MNIYIAAPFFKPEQIAFVENIEGKLDSLGVSYFSPRSEGTLSEMDAKGRMDTKAGIFKKNITGIEKADIVIAVIDDRDTGTTWEMGYAYASNKPVISISNNDYGINIMLAESARAHLKSLDEIPRALLDPTYRGHLTNDVY